MSNWCDMASERPDELGNPGEGEAEPSTRASAPAFSTGGGGFVFEDVVGGWAAAALLAGVSPFGIEFGVPTRVRFQGAALGFELDDVVVVGGEPLLPVLALSVKSFDMLRGAKVMSEFVEEAWAQLLSDGFRDGVDHVGFLSGSVAQTNVRALEHLISAARADTDAELAARIQVDGAFNTAHRSLWSSAACPAGLAAARGIDVASSPARLLRHLLVRHLDLLAPDSRSLAEAAAWCRQALVAEESMRAEELWEALRTHVSELRPAGGSLTWDSLLRHLRGRFIFRTRPDAASDWELLAGHTDAALRTVRDEVGDGLHLERNEAWEALAGAGEAPAVILTGPSGAGKTALAKRWLVDSDAALLWLGAAELADGLDGLRVRVGLRLDLLDVLRLAAGDVRIAIDGLDRAYDSAPAQVASLIASEAAESGGRLRVLIPCQEMELARLTRALAERSSPALEIVAMGNLDDEDVARVVRARPDLTRVVVAGQLVGVLRRPKLLDAVLRAGPVQSELLTQLQDETDVAALWWGHFVQSGEGASARAELALRLAEIQADQLAAGTAAGEIGAADAAYADALRRDGVLEPTLEQYAFSHDLFGDWTRLQRLRGLGDDALEWLEAKDQLPPWHRAIRLFGLARLRAGGIDRWAEDRAAFDTREQPLLADLFLDAVVFAHDARSLLEQLWPTLTAGDGVLLRRLLRRFLHVATYPDPRGQLAFGDAPELLAHWSARSRVPLWAPWLPVIETLAAHREQALELASKYVAAVADLWLRTSPAGWPLRRDAAELGLACGRFVIEHTTEGWHFDEELEKDLYRAALAAGAELPNELIDLLGTALNVNDETDEEADE